MALCESALEHIGISHACCSSEEGVVYTGLAVLTVRFSELTAHLHRIYRVARVQVTTDRRSQRGNVPLASSTLIVMALFSHTTFSGLVKH